eukprot:312765-Prymnesium_polylepis.1
MSACCKYFETVASEKALSSASVCISIIVAIAEGKPAVRNRRQLPLEHADVGHRGCVCTDRCEYATRVT